MPEFSSRRAAVAGRSEPVIGRDRGPQLLGALHLTPMYDFGEAAAFAVTGGLLRVHVENTGLAPLVQGFVEAIIVRSQIQTLGKALFVWEVGGPARPHFRRGRRGEELEPNAQVVQKPKGTSGFSLRDAANPETFVDPEKSAARSTLLQRISVGPLAPGESRDVELGAAATPAEPDQEQGLWTWCLIVRTFDVLQAPPVPLIVPTPAQQAHRTTMVCLHDLP